MKKTSCRNFIYRLSIILAFLLLITAGRSFASQSNEDIFSIAGTAMATGDYQTAINELNKIPVPENPDEDGAAFIKSRMAIAKMYHAQKKFKKSSDACSEILLVYPDNIKAKNFLKSLKREMKPGYILFFMDSIRFLPPLLKGALMTLTLVLSTILISPIGGLFIALGRIIRFKPVSGLCWFIIWLFRGTPLLLQLFFIYYGLPVMVGFTFSPMQAAVIGLGLNYSAYLAEIIRAGIESIDDGQMEAAKAIGMTYSQAMRRIIIPQTYKRLIPPVGNEFIALIKDTALVSTIAMVDLMRSANQIFNAYFNINVLILAAAIYLLFTTVFTLVFEKVEKKVGVYENR